VLKPSEKVVEFIKRAEGFREEAYPDGGRYSIGYGTQADYPSQRITPEEAERRLRETVEFLGRVIQSAVRVPLNQHQFDALVSFVYNVGVLAFLSSTLLKKLNRGDYKGAAEEFSRWVHSRGELVQGLVARREKEARMFLEGSYD